MIKHRRPLQGTARETSPRTLKTRMAASTILAHLAPTQPADNRLPTPSASRYVNQFLLGPRFADQLGDWQRLTVAGDLKLTAHPDLACTQISAGERELTLLGHILAPLAPEATNADILRILLDRFTSRDALIKATSGYGGRWLLVARSGSETFLFNDALGLRQAFFTDRALTQEFWVMSQPGLAAEVTALVPDEGAASFIDSEAFRRTFESRWPGTASPLKGLKHLLPNNSLDVVKGTVQRYWPVVPTARLEPDAAIERLLVLLPGLIHAAAARFDLALSLTAGIDSRVVLAAARKVVDRLSIVTLRQGRLPDGHPDIEVPARLLERLGLRHQVVYANSTMSPEFSFHFKRNVHLAHDHYGHDAEAILHHFGRTRAVLTGSGAEVGRRAFRDKLPHGDYVKFTPELVAWLEFGSAMPYIVDHFAEWLATAGRQRYVKLLDLLEWEQDYGNWLAMTQLEFDFAWREIFTPFNCRDVFTTFLGVDERYRREPDYSLFRKFIREAWPELLSEPINPHKRRSRVARSVAHAKAMVRYWRFLRGQRRLRARR